MFVKLRRNLFIGEHFFKARAGAVEIPDFIDGKPVVPHAEKGEGKIALPRDAVVLGEATPKKQAKDQAMALSEMTKKVTSPQSFKKAMEVKDDED
jgi:hypothetical protein